MTRKEEIELGWLLKAVQSNHRYDEKTFREAIEWADKTMIEKAWDWFYNMALDYMSCDITDVKWGSMKEDFFKERKRVVVASIPSLGFFGRN